MNSKLPDTSIIHDVEKMIIYEGHINCFFMFFAVNVLKHFCASYKNVTNFLSLKIVTIYDVTDAIQTERGGPVLVVATACAV